MSEFNEANSDFYDLEYFISLEYRYLSGAHSSKVRNIFKLIKNYIEDLKDKSILDVGCGSGFYTNEFYKLGGIVTGIDYSQFAIKFAKDRFHDIAFQVQSGYKLETFKDESFDIVTLFDVIEHMSDQSRTLDEVYRVLKPGGFFVISTDLDESLWKKWRFPAIIRKTEYFSNEGRAYHLIKMVEAYRRTFRNYHDSHIHELSSTELEELLRNAKFNILARKVYPLVGVPVRDMLLSLFPETYRGDHQCVIAQKGI